MMNGVEVLSQTTQWTANGREIFGGILFGIFCLLMVLCTIFAFIDESYGLGILCITLAIICALGSVFTGFIPYYTRTSYQEYKVTISDSVKMNEFNAKYDILSQEGKIYTITKKSGGN